MEFGSKFVFNYSDSEEEVVSDDEFEEGFTEDAYDVPKRVAIVGQTGKKGTHRPKSMGSSDLLESAPPSSAPPPPSVTIGSVFAPRARSARQAPSASLSSERKQKFGSNHHWELKDTSGRYENVKGRKCRRADTNIVSVKFGHLTSAGNMHTGDPVYCCDCGAVLSTISKLEQKGEDMVWTCEYCSVENIVDIVAEEIPAKDDITFMLLPAPTTTSGGRMGLDEMLIVFCVDVSGSMCVTTEVPGKVKLRGDHLDRLQSLNTERESQYLPGQRRNTTYVSRLQGVQAAVDFQLAEMAKNHPDRKVALVTFNSDVTAIGDGSAPPVHYSGDKLKSWDSMKLSGEEIALPQAIKHSRKKLSDKLFDLEEGGQTALGPALLLSVSIASRVNGSKVIICTDGMANIGLGSLDNINKDEDFQLYQHASTFYEEVSQLATEKGVSVSVTTIKGTDCKLMELGQVAANTQGQVNIVDPMKLTQEFGNILADATIATNVEATLVLHKGLYFRNEDDQSSKLSRQIGNVNKDTEITFEYGIRRRAKKQPAPEMEKKSSVIPEEPAKEPMETDALEQGAEATGATTHEATAMETTTTESKAPEASGSSEGASSSQGASSSKARLIDDMEALPFQVQIRYTDTDGGQAMRVITQRMPLTKDRNKAEKEMNPVLMGVHGAQQSAHMAMEGNYTASRLNAFMHQRLMVRNIDVSSDVYENYLDNVKPIENALLEHQQRERATKGRTYSDSEGSDDEDDAPHAPTTMSGRVMSLFSSRSKPKQKLKKKANRRMECSDDSANIIYNARHASSTSDAWKPKDKDKDKK